MIVSAYRIDTGHQQQAIGRGPLSTWVPDHLRERAVEYLAGCGCYYYVSDGEVLMFTVPQSPRERVDLFVGTLAELLAQAGISRIVHRTTLTGSAQLTVEYAGQTINMTITAARRP